jgi:hypothetical protein
MHRKDERAARYPHKGDSREFRVERAYSLCVGADRYAGGLLSRMPRPPVELVALSEISSIPLASSAATSFMSESTLPRMTPSLASIRWIVGSDRSDNFASLRWSIRSIARAARSCAAVIMFYVSVIKTKPLMFALITAKVRVQVGVEARPRRPR